MLLLVDKPCPTLCSPMHCSMPGSSVLTISCSLLKFMSTESMMLSNHLILCHHLLLLLSLFPSIRVFSSELPFVSSGKSIRSVSFSNSSPNEYSEVISFRIDWFDILAVQRPLKSLLQHHNSKASILQRSAFFIVQLSYLYMTTEKKKKT